MSSVGLPPPASQPILTPPPAGEPAALRLGDILPAPLYGRPNGAQEAVLLLAGGRRIESEQQLRLLRDAGWQVCLPSEARPALPSAESSSPAAAALPLAAGTGPAAEFHASVETAGRVRNAVTGAVRHLFASVAAEAPLDLKLLKEISARLITEMAGAPAAISALTYLRQCDDYTVEHSADVAILMCGIGRTLGMRESKLQVMALAGLLHDVGKQRVPAAILCKPAALTREEFAEMRKHPQYGVDLLQACDDCPEMVRAVTLQHHERLDGSGYPGELTWEEILPASQIAAVADTFDAMVSDRVYRRGLPAREALLELYRLRGKGLDATAVDALIKLVGVYPVGTAVLLKSGERGVVIAPNPEDSLHPLVRIDQDPQGRRLSHPAVIALRSGAQEILRALP